MHLVFMLEEPSAKSFLDGLLPRILPSGITFQTIPHEGRTHLQRSLPKKLRAWRTPDTRFVVLHDQDSNDCKQLRQKLVDLCNQAGHRDVLVRIACYELEAWYCGDLKALAQVYPSFDASAYEHKAKFRQPDAIYRPSVLLGELIPEFQKGAAARKMPGHMDLNANASPSFQSFLAGVRRLCADPTGDATV